MEGEVRKEICEIHDSWLALIGLLPSPFFPKSFAKRSQMVFKGLLKKYAGL